MFYNDEEDGNENEQPPTPKTLSMPKKYKRRRIITIDWEASKAHAGEAKDQNNVMTQKCYLKKLLPIYVDAQKEDAEKSTNKP
ncbi:uncharacterized protein EAF01_002096 [Botrytis porri]|nr:uncharacterized protein EAF01_002096 [Botrytis porri]KAF7910585.1 hypothetical protein EAF01_002096 [Botrytis porri]